MTNFGRSERFFFVSMPCSRGLFQDILRRIITRQAEIHIFGFADYRQDAAGIEHSPAPGIAD